MKTARGTMAATTTYAQRWWLWIEAPGMPCDGFLLLGQIKDKATATEIDEQTYGIQEVRSPHGIGWRSFSVRKLGTDLGAADEQYTTSIGPRGSVCTCKAGSTRQEVCRHRCGLSAAIAAGAIPKKQLQGA
jgi:hypothetical protein